MKDPLVLFYPHTARAFRTTLIGHLYEIAQVYPVVLLSEQLDDKLNELLQRRELFPRLEAIIPVDQFAVGGRNPFHPNVRLAAIAKKVIRDYRPSIVITASDMHSLFDMYLLRYAKKINSLIICVQPTLNLETIQSSRYVDLLNAYTRMPEWLPLVLRMMLVKGRKWIGHFYCHWIMPLCAGELPLNGSSSFVLLRGNSGMRDANFQVVFSARDGENYVKDGVMPSKIVCLRHPLTGPARPFMMNNLISTDIVDPFPGQKKALLFMPAEEIAFKAGSYSVITKEQRQKLYADILRDIARILEDWQIIIKPHPDLMSPSTTREWLRSIIPNGYMVDPTAAVDQYVEISDLIIELPRAVSTATFTALLQCPGKPIWALDFDHEYLGDLYRDVEGVEYIDDKEDFLQALISIKQHQYHEWRQKKKISASGKVMKFREFPDIIAAIRSLREIHESCLSN
ncbi:MAG: hypothetical protein NTV58_08965 [Deltaproteobacteria bacterium]|nr:hypothetical protein [Deltaproteobacteria bacterium]